MNDLVCRTWHGGCSSRGARDGIPAWWRTANCGPMQRWCWRLGRTLRGRLNACSICCTAPSSMAPRCRRHWPCHCPPPRQRLLQRRLDSGAVEDWAPAWRAARLRAGQGILVRDFVAHRRHLAPRHGQQLRQAMQAHGPAFPLIGVIVLFQGARTARRATRALRWMRRNWPG